MKEFVYRNFALEPETLGWCTFCISVFVVSVFADFESADSTTWTARSGSIWVLCGVISAFRNINDRLERFLQTLSNDKEQEELFKFLFDNSGRISRRSVFIEVSLVAVGTVIWGYADIIIG